MALTNLFLGLSATREDVTTCESAVLDREPSDIEPRAQTVGNGRPLKRRKITRQKQSDPANTHKAPVSYKDYDTETKDFGQPAFNFIEELTNYSLSNKAAECIVKVKENGGYMQHEKSERDSDKYSQGNRGGYSNKHCHRGTNRRDTSSRGRGQGAGNRGKLSGRSHSWAIQDRDVPKRSDWSKMGPKKTDQSGRFAGVHKPQRDGQHLRGRGRYSKQPFNKLVPEVKKRPMTEEFKKQNVVEVDGRLICRHFLLGKCTKGDECQLEHTQDVHNTFKEVCKYYVQGFCTREDKCPYMHKSFPCKFFHKLKRCRQGAECRFSHEPLTDLTRHLLEEALKKDIEISEMVKRSQLTQEDGVTVDQMEPAVDILVHPIRPNFYNSVSLSEPQLEKTTPVCEPGALAIVTEKETVAPQIQESTPLHSPPSCHPTWKEPVSYSVEAVLRAQKPQLYSTVSIQEGSFQESISSSSSEQCPHCHAKQEEAPYSVNVILSRKATEKCTCKRFSGPSDDSFTGPPLHIKPCSQKPGFDKDHGKASQLDDTVRELHRPLKSSFQSLFSSPVGQIPASQNSTEKNSYSLSAPDGGPSLVGLHLPGDMVQPESINTTDSALSSEDGRSKKDVSSVDPIVESSHPKGLSYKSLFSSLPRQTSALKQSVQKKHLSHAPSGLKNLFQTLDPRPTFAGCRNADSPLAKTVCGSHNDVTYPDSTTEKCALSEKKQAPVITSNPQNGFHPPDPNPKSTDCKRKTTLNAAQAVRSDETLKRPFNSLFASRLCETSALGPSIQAKPDSIRTPLCSVDSIESTYTTPVLSDCAGKHIPVNVVHKQNNTTDGTFKSLFARPISESAVKLPSVVKKEPQRLPHPEVSVQPVASASSLGDRKENPSSLKTSFKSLFAGSISKDVTDSPPTSRCLDSLPRNKNGKPNKINSADPMNNFSELGSSPSNLFPELTSKTSTPSAHTNPTLGSSRTRVDAIKPDMSSNQASSKTSTSNSVLKTLFLRLSPCHLEEDQRGDVENSVQSGSGDAGVNATGSILTQPTWMTEEEDSLKECREDEVKAPESSFLKDGPIDVSLEPSSCVPPCDPCHPLKTDTVLLKPSIPHSMVQSTPSHPVPQPSNTRNLPVGSLEPSVEKTVKPLDSAGCLSCSQHLASQEAADSSSAHLTEVHLSTRGIHNLPVKSTSLMAHAHRTVPPKQLLGQKKSLQCKVGEQTMKEYFRHFDPTGSPFGQ